MEETIYICVGQAKKVKNSSVKIKDIASIWCENEELKEKVGNIEIYEFTDEKENRVIFTTIKLIQEIEKKIGNKQIVPLGDSDILIEYEKEKNSNKLFEYFKVAIICITLFFGAGFTIMAFNNEIAVHSLFEQYYYMMTKSESDGFTILEITYSIGIGLGIIVFYNHIGKKRLSKDPTPLEVEMRMYENEINNTLIDGVKRKDAHIDVD